jgi:hypothetical protein
MTKEQAAQWLFDHQSEEGSPEFTKVLQTYILLADKDPLKAAKAEYDRINKEPKSEENLRALDRLRTKIEEAGGQAPLSDAPLVTQGESSVESPAESSVESSPKDSGLPSQEEFNQYVQEARKAQLVGGAAGALRYAPSVIGAVAGPALGSLSQSMEEGRMRARPPAIRPSGLPQPTVVDVTPTPLNPTGGQVGGQAAGRVITDPRAPVQPTMDQVTRQVQGNVKEPGTSMAVTGRASQTGYQARTSEIAEAQKAQRQALEALGRKTVLGPIPQGITGSSPTGILVPPSALEPLPPPTVGAAGIEPRMGMNTPQGPYVNPQTLRSLPAATTAPPPVSSGLDQVRQTFIRLANTPLGQNVSRAASVLRKGAGALGTVAAGSEVGLNLYDMVKALEDEKYGRAAMSAGKAAAMGASIMTPYGLIPAALLYGADYLSDAQARANMKALHGMSPQRAYESEGGFYNVSQ